MAHQFGVFIHHPAHHLAGCSYIGCGHVIAGADEFPDNIHVTASQSFFFADRQGCGIHDDAAFTAAQRDVGDSAFPGHPGRQSADGVQGLGGMPADAALIGAAGVIVLNTEALEYTKGTVIHANGDAEAEFAHWPAQHFTYFAVKTQQISYVIELSLCHFKSIGFV